MMLRTLRIKFIAINMLLAVLVISGAFGAVLYADYMTRFDAIVSELKFVISEATTPHAPQITSTQKLKASPDGTSLASTSGSSKGTSSKRSSAASSSGSAPTIGMPSATRSSIILVSVYNVKPNGIYTTLGDYTNATIPESTILGANDSVLHSNTNNGYLSEYNLFYLRQASPSAAGEYIVAYADGSSMKDWQNLAWALIISGVAGLIVLFFINIFFSKWALKPVEVSIKQQQQFTADASHELKTPLTVILANMSILKSQPDARIEDQMQWVDSTHTEAERMQLLVNDMLSLSRPEKQKPQYQKEDIDFSDLVEGEVLQFESVAFELGVELEDEIEEGLHVYGNHERLGRMVATLIDNACKYAGTSEYDQEPNSGIEGLNGADDIILGAVDEYDFDSEDDERSDGLNPPVVTVTLARKLVSGSTRAKAELKVHNTGAPISEEDLPYIFQRFYRADKVRTSSKGGYGLGLAIGQEIAHEHEGAIIAESSAEDGTTFTVTLPLSDNL